MSNRNSQTAALAQGVYVALTTPCEPNSVEADASALLEYIDTIVGAGVDGLVLFGTTGEFTHYDMSERVRVLSLATKRSPCPLAGERFPFLLCGRGEPGGKCSGGGRSRRIADAAILFPLLR